MQNILSLIEFKKQLEEHERVALLLYDPETELSRLAFRNITEVTYLNDSPPVFVVDVNEVSDIQSHYQLVEIPSLLFFVKSKLVDVVKGNSESDLVKALFSHEFFNHENEIK